MPIASVEGFVRQVIGWRDYIWNLYWHLGPDYRHRNALHARRDIPAWFAELDADAVRARCLSSVLARGPGTRLGAPHPRLMVLGNYAMQRGWNPAQVTDWFHRAFVDGYDWVMVPNVVGMSQYADGGLITTKPYAGGGAYINRMSDYCGGCALPPSVRVGEKACPFTAGYWWFLNRHRRSSPAITGWRNRFAGWTGSRTSTPWSSRRTREALRLPESRRRRVRPACCPPAWCRRSR